MSTIASVKVWKIHLRTSAHNVVNAEASEAMSHQYQHLDVMDINAENGWAYWQWKEKPIVEYMNLTKVSFTEKVARWSDVSCMVYKNGS